MKKIFLISISALVLPMISCGQWPKNLQGSLNNVLNNGTAPSAKPTDEEVIGGLKEALQNGINNGADRVSKPDGFFKDLAIKILMPPDAKKVEDKLREIGLGAKVDQAIESMNRAAEKAAIDSKPIFVNAIKSMSFTDAWGILKGTDDAATQYLKKTCTAGLTEKFMPVIKNALDAVSATKYWKDVFDTYNKIPFVTPVNSDLTSYVTQKALEGLFHEIAAEEAKIRKDPLAQVTALLKKVFGWKG